MNGDEMRRRLLRYWEGDPESEKNVKEATPGELFEMWLEYEGIIAYGERIIRALRECGYKVEVADG